MSVKSIHPLPEETWWSPSSEGHITKVRISLYSSLSTWAGPGLCPLSTSTLQLPYFKSVLVWNINYVLMLPVTQYSNRWLGKMEFGLQVKGLHLWKIVVLAKSIFVFLVLLPSAQSGSSCTWVPRVHHCGMPHKTQLVLFKKTQWIPLKMKIGQWVVRPGKTDGRSLISFHPEDFGLHHPGEIVQGSGNECCQSF